MLPRAHRGNHFDRRKNLNAWSLLRARKRRLPHVPRLDSGRPPPRSLTVSFNSQERPDVACKWRAYRCLSVPPLKGEDVLEGGNIRTGYKRNLSLVLSQSLCVRPHALLSCSELAGYSPCGRMSWRGPAAFAGQLWATGEGKHAETPAPVWRRQDALLFCHAAAFHGLLVVGRRKEHLGSFAPNIASAGLDFCSRIGAPACAMGSTQSL